MIYTRLSIVNPWYGTKFERLFAWSKKLCKFKAIEVELYYSDYYLFEFLFEITRRVDHAGMQFEINLFGLTFHLMIYDTRHWNDENQDWENYDNTNSKTSS